MGEKYLFPLYIQVATRDEFIGLEEARALRIETFVLLQQARERLRVQSPSGPTHSPIRAGLQHSDIVDILAETFDISLADVVLEQGNPLLSFLD